MKLTQNQTLGAIILIAVGFVAGGILAFQNAEADLTDQEVYRIIMNWHIDNSHLYVSQQELADAHELINEAIAAPHTQYVTNVEYETLQEQIFNVRAEMVRKHPMTPEEDPARPENLSLKVKVRGDIFFVGQNISIFGTGEANRPVFVFASAPNRSIEGATVADENGDWVVDLTTRFNDDPGIWWIRVTQDQLRAEPISIEVKP